MTASPSPIHIMRAGRHTATSGEAHEFTEQVMRESAQAYDPALHEAPIVIGHPTDNAPAYGWVQRLDYADGLLAHPHQVEPTFAQAVRSGHYKKVSASFYRPASRSNPTPGVYYLRHVAFLGAHPPAVKGLKPVELGEAEEGVVTVEFGEFGPAERRTLGDILRGLREFVLEKFGRDEADRTVPSYAIEQIETEPAEPEPSAFSESTAEDDMIAEKQKEIAAKEEEIKAKEKEQADKDAEFAERERKIVEGEAKAKREAAAEFAEGLVGEGKILPKHKPGLVELMSSLDDAAELEFGEGDEKAKKAPAAVLREFLAELPTSIDYGERAPGDAPPPADEEPDAEAIARQAAEFVEAERKAGRTVSTTQAVAHVTQKKAG